MSTLNPEAGLPPEEPLIDVLLRDTLPEVKLALGRIIDRENARAVPERYAQLLPETVLVVTLRPDAAEALLPVAPAVERELTDSCMRHGSLYDREYRVQLRRAERESAALYAVSSHPVSELEEVEAERLTATPAAAPVPGLAPDSAPEPTTAFDPDATRLEGVSPPAGWEAGRFALAVEDDQGGERESFPLVQPATTVGRRSRDPSTRSDVGISEAPHVSRRQLALVWEPRAGEPGFRVYNLGLNTVHLGERDLPGANLKQGPLRLEELQGEHVGWVAPGEALRIGEKGPVLRVREAGPPAPDPDATQFG
jgi:hypothetical protein